MAAFTTTLDDYQTLGDLKSYTISGHTALDPYLLIQKRKAPSSPNANLESTLAVVKQTRDSDLAVVPARVMFEAKVKYPKLGNATDVTAALAVFRDFVASDEFGAMVTNQSWVQ